jgi:transposase InsO family protein
MSFSNLNFRYMKQLSKKGIVIGLPDIHFSEGVCEGCVLGKHPQEKFDKGKAHMASSPLDLIHSDLMGPFPNPSIGKARYVLTFLDDYSCHTWVFFLRHKLEVFEHLKEFKALVETQSGRNIKTMCTDNGGGGGGGYVNRDVQNICLEDGIQLQHKIPCTPQQNKVAERKNKFLKEMSSFMWHASSLP